MASENGRSSSFKSLVSLLELYETAARVRHPQSNGKLKLCLSTLKKEARVAERREKLLTAAIKKKSLLAATVAGLKHLISFPKKVQVHFGQNSIKILKQNGNTIVFQQQKFHHLLLFCNTFHFLKLSYLIHSNHHHLH